MAETVTKKAICGSCGAAVRERSVFCYNCGESVEKRSDISLPVPSDKTNGRQAEEVSPAKTGDRETAPKPPETYRDGDGKPKLRSAASMRGKIKAYNRKPVEVVWAEPDKPPPAYIIASIVLVVFTVVMLVLAWVLK